MQNPAGVTYSSAIVVTKSDTADNAYSAFFTQGAGNVAFKDLAGTTITLTAVPIFTIIPIATSKIMSTNTTSTGIIGLN